MTAGIENVQQSLSTLATAAASLNVASDRLGVVVEGIEAELKKLNLGVSAWYTLARGSDTETTWTRGIGYTKVGGKWCIALRETRDSPPAKYTEQVWPFKDAPRWLRLDAVGHIPQLLEELTERAHRMTDLCTKRVEQAEQIAAAMYLTKAAANTGVVEGD